MLPDGQKAPLNPQADMLSVPLDELLDLMKDVLAKGGEFQFEAKGWSMTPFIKNGDRITVAPFDKNTLSIGRVVAFILPVKGHLAIHRIIGKQGAGWLTQGDNISNKPDGVVLPQDMLGWVKRIERNKRRIYLGQGPERYAVAFLSRKGLLTAVVGRLRAVSHLVMRGR
jgi:hypothetical protein